MYNKRDLDYLVAKHILKWKKTKIPADYNGENEGCCLTESGKIPDWFRLPPVGKLHPAYFVPQYSYELKLALQLAKKCNLDLNTLDIDDSERIIKDCLIMKGLSYKDFSTNTEQIRTELMYELNKDQNENKSGTN